MSGVMTTQLEKRLTGVSGLFGTSGIRADISRDVYVNFWMEIAQAVGTRLAPGAKVCIATDTRVSRGAVKAAVVSGLLAAGVDVSDLGILPTPVLARLTGDMGFDSGVMITASHNPPQFNGIKLFNGNSQGYSKEQEVEVERIYRDKSFRTNFRGNFLWLQGAKERLTMYQMGFSRGGTRSQEKTHLRVPLSSCASRMQTWRSALMVMLTVLSFAIKMASWVSMK